MKKITVVIISVLVLLMSLPVISYASNPALQTILSEPQATEHTAYLVIRNVTTARLIEVSSPSDISQLYMNAYFTGTKWQLAIGSLMDGLATTVTITRYNALTGAYENSWKIDASSYTVQDILSGSSFTEYISYGIPVESNPSYNLQVGAIDWRRIEDTLSLLYAKLTSMDTDVQIIRSTVNAIDLTLSNISSVVSKINTTTTQMNTKLTTIQTHLNNIKKSLEENFPIIEDQLDTLHYDLTQIMYKLDTVISQLETANFWLENIYNKLDNPEATTIKPQENSELNEYESREQELMQDKSNDIENALDSAYNSLDQRGIASINTMLNNIVFAVPELTTLIIFCLAVGLVVLILGRKVS